MRTGRSNFDLIVVDGYCDIATDDTALFLPLTMSLEECIEICCEEVGTELLEIKSLHRHEASGACEGTYSYVY